MIKYGWIQILIILLTTLLFYKRFIKDTSSEKLVHGLVGLLMLWAFSFVLNWLKLDLLAAFLHWVALFLSVGLIVIFQPELRKFLALMGNVKFFKIIFSSNTLKKASQKDHINHSVEEVIKASQYLSEHHIGALIVFKDVLSDDNIEKTGVKLDADISSELLITIFFNKTPLHDGAVIISNNRILCASAILPLTQKSGLGWKYGTRHRAAIGLSEVSESCILVVSEETGDISIVHKGGIKKYNDIKKLKSYMYKIIN